MLSVNGRSVRVVEKRICLLLCVGVLVMIQPLLSFSPREVRSDNNIVPAVTPFVPSCWSSSGVEMSSVNR